MNTPKQDNAHVQRGASLVASTGGLGLFAQYTTEADIEAEKQHYDTSTPFEIVAISAILKGLEEYAQETANDEMADGFTGQEAHDRALAYYECRERLMAYWSRLP